MDFERENSGWKYFFLFSTFRRKTQVIVSFFYFKHILTSNLSILKAQFLWKFFRHPCNLIHPTWSCIERARGSFLKHFIDLLCVLESCAPEVLQRLFKFWTTYLSFPFNNKLGYFLRLNIKRLPLITNNLFVGKHGKRLWRAVMK